MQYEAFFYFFITALLIGLLSGPFMIKWLRSLNFKQYIREDGPKKHLIKSGVPTMGGFIFVTAWLLSSLIWIRDFSGDFFFVLLSTLAYGVVGLLDDYRKIMKKQNEGLTMKGKFVFILLASLLLWALFLRHFSISIPFTDIRVDNPVLSVIFISLLYSALTNATNFTDGLDGLLASVSLPIILFLALVSFKANNGILFSLNSLFAGALASYLFFNRYPAKVMMGDFGSLAIGGFILANALILDIYWFIPIFGIWYVIEVVSVMIQIVYFKKTGKRFFKMAPYHHHLELCFFSENKIVLLASFITLVACVLSYIALYGLA